MTQTTAGLDRRELLRLLDHVESLVRWCSVSMLDVPRFTRGETAMWAIAHRLAGKDEIANKLIRENNLMAEPPI